MDERASRRVVIDLTVQASISGRPGQLIAYDLSIDGCMVDTGDEPLPAAGTKIELQLPLDNRVTGALVWTHGRFGGVKFDERLAYALVEKLGFKPSSETWAGFRDRFGRPLALPGERFRL